MPLHACAGCHAKDEGKSRTRGALAQGRKACGFDYCLGHCSGRRYFSGSFEMKKWNKGE